MVFMCDVCLTPGGARPIHWIIHNRRLQSLPIFPPHFLGVKVVMAFVPLTKLWPKLLLTVPSSQGGFAKKKVNHSCCSVAVFFHSFTALFCCTSFQMRD